MSYAIPLAELMKEVPEAQLNLAGVPTWLKHLHHAFGVSDLRSYWDDKLLIYEGRLRLLIPKDRIALPWGKWRFIVHVLHEGLPFTLWLERKKKDSSATTLEEAEPADRPFQLLVQLSTLTIEFDPAAVKPARLRTDPQFVIEPVEGGESPRLTLPQASLFFDSNKGLTFAACQSWEDLARQSGDFILQTQLTPRYVTIADLFGLGLDRIILDLSSARTPAAAQRLPGHGPEWQGIYLDELLICAPLRMPEWTLAARAQEFAIGFDGRVSGQFAVEYARNYGLDDGRLKFEKVDLLDEEGNSLRPQGEDPETYLDKYEFRLEQPDRRSARFRMTATVTGAQAVGAGPVPARRLLWLLRVDGKDALNGETVVGDQTPTPKAEVKTGLFEVGDGIHEVGLFVAQEPPVGSGVRFVTRLAVAVATGAFEDNVPIQVTVTRPGQNGFEATALTYVECVAPATLVAEHDPPVPTDQVIKREWALVPAPPDGYGKDGTTGERLEATLSKPGEYRLTLRYSVSQKNAPSGPPLYSGQRCLEVKVLEALGDAALDNVFLTATDDDAYRGRAVQVHNCPRDADLSASLALYRPTTERLRDLVGQKAALGDLLPGTAPAPSPPGQPVVDAPTGSVPLISFPVSPDAVGVLDVEVKRKSPHDLTATTLSVAACFGKDKTETVTALGRQAVQTIAENVRRNTHVSLVKFVVDDPQTLGRGEALYQALVEALGPGWKGEPAVPHPLCKGEGRSVEVQWVHRAPLSQALPVEPDRDTIVVVLEGTASTSQVARRRVVALPLLAEKVKLPALPSPPPVPPAFKASWFRRLRVECGLLRNVPTRGQVEVVADLYDLKLPDAAGIERTQVNDAQGLVRFVAGITRDPVSERLRIQSSYQADPRDKDGLFPLKCKKSDDPREKALAWLRLYLFALPPAAACSSDPATRGVATGVAAGLATALSLLPKPADPALKVSDLQVRAFHLRVEAGGNDRDLVVVGVDYDCSVELKLDVAGFALKTENNPILVQYRNVGLAFGGDKGFDFFYEPATGLAIDVKDTGLLKLPSWASSLLSVMRLRLGIGSPLTVDVELGLKQNLGIIKLSSLPLQVSFQPAVGSLEGKLAVKVGAMRVGVDLPEVLSGSGLIQVDEKRFLGSLYLEFVRPKFKLEADLGLSFKDDYTAIYAALYAEWGVGVPLANSGAALYGLAGLFAMHWGRKAAADAYQWYVDGPTRYSARDIQKWEEKKGNLAFGAGVVIGTLADGGRALNLKGMLILELPGPRFLLAVRATLLSDRSRVGDSREGSLVAVVDLDFQANRFLIKLAVRYSIDKVLSLQVPAEAFFELPAASRAGSYHIWIGHDKKQELQVQLKVFGLLTAWGYLMIQSGDLDNLAGTGVRLPGPCIAFGLHAGFQWGKPDDPIHLEAFIELHVGLGLAPIFFYGMLRLGGTLHLFIVGIGAWARLQAQADPKNGFSLEGQVCGYVQLLFWKLEGCIEFKLGPEPKFSPPDPVVESLTFRSRANKLPLSAALAAGSAGSEPRREAILGVRQAEVRDWDKLHPVPIDCVPILQFRTGITCEQAPAGCFDLTANQPAPTYWEQISDRLQYAYRLTELRLFEVQETREVEVTGKPYPAAWSLDQGERRTTLQLNEWLPLLDWTVEEHTARGLPAQAQALCEAVPPLERHLYTFEATRLGAGEAWCLRPAGQPNAPPVTVRCPPRSDVEAALMQSGRGAYARAQVIAHTPAGLPAQLRQITRVLKLPLDGSTLVIEAPGLSQADIYLAGDLTYWAGRVTDEGGQPIAPVDYGQSACRTYTVPAAGRVRLDLSAEGAAGVLTETLRAVYLVAVEGVAAGEEVERARLAQGRDQARQVWQHRLLHGTGEQRLLKPGTRYLLRLKVRWTRRAFKGEERTPLPETDGEEQVGLAFRTPGDVPGDLSAYVHETLPAPQAESHYCYEPLFVRFKTASIHQQMAAYDGRRFLIVAKSEQGLAAGELSVPQMERDAEIRDPLEQAVVDAMRSLSCLSAPPARRAFDPTVSLVYRTHFRPNTGYTAYLVTLPESQVLASLSAEELAHKALAEGQQHYIWKFTTSRYATFSQHVAAHEGLADWIVRDAPATGYRAEIDKALGQAATAPQERRSTALLDHILYDLLHCEALPPAWEPAGYRLWLQSDGPQGPAWECLGLLLDSPEPLFHPGRTRLAVSDRSSAQKREVSFALATNDSGTRALIWAPGLRGDRLWLEFTLKKQPIPGEEPERSESKILPTYVLDKPGAYLEEN